MAICNHYGRMPNRAAKPPSGCPINAAVEVIGHRIGFLRARPSRRIASAVATVGR
jgi:hypothetical protein